MNKFRSLVTFFLSLSLMLLVAGKAWALSSEEILSAVNVTRNGSGKTSLTVNRRLQAAAAMKLADIQQYRYWAHNNPTTGTIWTTFIRKSGYWGRVGENLASNYGSANEVINGWLNSPTHRANLLNDNYREVGVAIGNVDFGSGSEIVVVAEFGSGVQRGL